MNVHSFSMGPELSSVVVFACVRAQKSRFVVDQQGAALGVKVSRQHNLNVRRGHFPLAAASPEAAKINCLCPTLPS